MIHKRLYYLVIIFLQLSGITGKAQENNRSMALTDFAIKTREYQEGFVRSLPGNDFSYHSFRNDLTDALLTRCNDGSMAIEWQTSEVNVEPGKKGSGFVWIAAIDMTDASATFDVYINGVKRFIIPTGNREKFELESEDGGILAFITVEMDQHSDAHGYMSLWAPNSWLSPGKPLDIKIVGSASGSNSWIIIYKALDAFSYLQESVRYNSWAKLLISGAKSSPQLQVQLPKTYAGKTVSVKINKKSYLLNVTDESGNQICRLSLKKAIPVGASVAISDEYGEILSLPSIDAEGKSTRLTYKALLQADVIKGENSYEIHAIRTYKPKTVSSLKALAGSGLAKGTIYLMNSSHQDIAWMDSPEKCILLRDTMLLTPLFDKAQTDPEYRFDIEDALMLKEYITRHPERKSLVASLLKSGNLSCGSSYTQPYEEILSGEALSRQFYFGARWLKKEFGYTANTYWNQDVPGRTLQMPQILQKSGTNFLALSRMEKGIFKWYSPDGSFVTTYSAGHYGTDFTPLQRNFYEAAEYIAKNSMSWKGYYEPNADNPVIPLFSDWDMSPAKDYSHLIRDWNQITEIQDEKGNYIPIELPKIKLALTPDFINEFSNNASIIPKHQGERPAVWLYIHGPTHQKAIKASREADILLTAAEKFATANAWTNQSFRNYPVDKLNEAWESRIYPDHGWGGKHGDITDALFQEKYYHARNLAEEILFSNLKDIASRIVLKRNSMIPLVVFNSVSWERSDPVFVPVSLDPAYAWQLEVQDASGNIKPCQLSDIKQYSDGSIRSAKLCFVAEKVPSIGYKTYYLRASDKKSSIDQNKHTGTFENEFYSVKLTAGGIASLYDKVLKQEILDTTTFKGAEVFTLHSEGTGAGEFADIQQVDMQGLDKASNYPSQWVCMENGDVYTEFRLRQPIQNAMIEQSLRFYHQIKRIDINLSLLNYEGILYREYRIAFPLKMQENQLSYEVPFGVLNVGLDEFDGAAGERYTTKCSEIHPRGIGNWISASNSQWGASLSSSVAVVDYIDPSNPDSKKLILQPILLSSRRSCHEEGNEYLQTGDHHFSFSLFTHAPGWINGFRNAQQANENLYVVTDPNSFSMASLPEELSFFSTQSPDLILSTVKQQEDGKGTTFRVYNISPEPTELNFKGFLPLKKAHHANLLEFPAKELLPKEGSVIFPIGAYGIETFIVE
ncbi:MAG: alpha-mannosidase [Bacteroidales bacterium]|nr:alpha-mannosidase [Bacteroidales bacterium]